MTKEEIIDFCEMKSQLEPENEDIFNYIIKALEQEPCEDCISRQVVLKQLKGCLIGGETEYQYVKLHIDSIPPVTPRSKAGKWIEYECDEDKYDRIECSECGQSFIVDSYHWCDIGFTKDDLMYCPNCGQPKMQEAKE